MKYNLLILNCMFFPFCWAMDKTTPSADDITQSTKPPKSVRFSSDSIDQRAAFEEERKRQLNELLKTYKPGQRTAKK